MNVSQLSAFLPKTVHLFVDLFHLQIVHVMADGAVRLAVLPRHRTVVRHGLVNPGFLSDSQRKDPGLRDVRVPAQMGLRTLPADPGNVVEIDKVGGRPVAVQAIRIGVTHQGPHHLRQGHAVLKIPGLGQKVLAADQPGAGPLFKGRSLF